MRSMQGGLLRVNSPQFCEKTSTVPPAARSTEMTIGGGEQLGNAPKAPKQIRDLTALFIAPCYIGSQAVPSALPRPAPSR